MKRLLRTLLMALACAGISIAFNTADANAGTIKYQYVDGTPVQKDNGGGTMVDVTSDTSSAAFTEAITEIGDTNIIGFVHENALWQGAYGPDDADLSDGDRVVVVTKDKVTAGDKFGTHNTAWYIYNNTLYIISRSKTGAEFYNEADPTWNMGTYDRTINFTGQGFDKQVPVMERGDIDTDGFGMSETVLGDEKTLEEDEYFGEYIHNSATSKFLSIGARDALQLNGVKYSEPSLNQNGSIIDAGAMPWIDHAAEITKVVFGTNVRAKGNLAQLFNGNTADPEDHHRYDKVLFDDANKVGPSRYTSLNTVVIYSDFSGVTSTAAMFARCPALTTVAACDPVTGAAATTFPMPALLTSAFMFYGDTELDNASTNSLVNIMDLSSGTLKNTSYMYAGCESINNPYIKDYNMSEVENIDGMFQGAKNANIAFEAGSAANASVGNWNTAKVKTAMYTFAGVLSNQDAPNKGISPSLAEIPENHVVSGAVELDAWDWSSCISTYHMFAQNLGIDSVTFDTSYPALKDAAGMFNGCDNLSHVSMSSCGMPELLYAHAMFRRAGKESGGTADLSGWAAPKLEATDYMFQGSGYNTINFNNSSHMSHVKETIAMFADCPNLRTLGTDSLSHFDLSSVYNSKYMFDNDTALTAVNTTDWDMSNVEDMTHMFCNTPSLSMIDMSQWTVGASDSDGDSEFLRDMECFAYHSGITSASLKNWDTSQVANMYMAFAECPMLGTVTLPDAGVPFAAVEDMNGMFYNDPELTSVDGDDTGHYAAPALVNARGMFANDEKLNTVGLSFLVKGNATNISYMFRNCKELPEIDLTGWETDSVEFMQGIFDNCSKLVTITPGSAMHAGLLRTMAMAFNNCYKLTSDSLNGVLRGFGGSTNLESMYKAFNNCYALTSLDMSLMDLSGCVDLVHLAYMEETAETPTNHLVTIKVPSTILTAPGVITTDGSDGNGTSINMFWVDGDGVPDGSHNEYSEDDDLPTTFFVNGPIPEKLAAYNFGGMNGDNDNRSFVEYIGKSINGDNTGTYTFTSETDTALLKMDAESTFYKNGTTPETGTRIPMTYMWGKDDSTLPGTTNTYSTAPNAAGVYKSTALLGEITGSNSRHAVTFELTGATIYEKSIDATYKGTDIYVGEKYSKDDVEVIYHKSNGTTQTLTSNQFTVDSVNVTKEGPNTYTVTYDPGDGALTDTITVDGKKSGEQFITSVYDGDPVEVSSNYVKADVKVTYTDRDGVEKTLSPADFTVDSQRITKIGDNTFTASYTPAGSTKKLTDTFVVPGIADRMTLAASYKGDKVVVGGEYLKSDVQVVLTLKNGTKVTLTPDDFKVDSLKVTKAGDNTFTATYTTEDGDITAMFKVPGKRVIGSIKAEYSGPAVKVGNEYSTSDVTVTAYYVDDTSKTEGFAVTPSGFSSTKVSRAGDNSFTASYKDPDQNNKVFTAPFKVNGYKDVTSIAADYTGGKVKVGKSYEKKKVKVTLYYDDGTTSTTENFTLDSRVVTGEGDNSYTATYRDPYGNTYTAGFTVPGYKDDDDDKKKSSSSSIYYGYGWYPGLPANGVYGDYAGVSSVFPGSGYAASSPVFGPTGALGVSTGIVQTGTTLKSVLYALAGITLILMLAGTLYVRFKKDDKKNDE